MLQPYLTGVVYGAAHEELTVSALTRGLEIDEQDRNGHDISQGIARATLLVYNFLVSRDGKSLGCSIHSASNQDQVIRSISQLISANITSDDELFHGASHAALAIGDHLSRRGHFSPTERVQHALTGMIVSAFTPDRMRAQGTVNAEPHPVNIPDDAGLPALKLDSHADDSGPGSEEEDQPPVSRNKNPLSREQCALLSRLLKVTADENNSLDEDCTASELGNPDSRTLRTLMGSAKSIKDLNKLECVLAAADAFGRRVSTRGLSPAALNLMASVVDMAWNGIVENVCYELPANFLGSSSETVLRELAEDVVYSLEDPQASVEDYAPLTAQNLNRCLNLVDCLQGMACRLRAIAAS